VGEGSNKRLAIALGCMALAAVVSGLLLFQHHGEPGAVSAVNEACGDGQTSGCEQVARSAWSAVGGIPLATLGLGLSLLLASALTLGLLGSPEVKDALASLCLVVLGAALGVDIVLAGIQAFAVKAFCALCAATYVLNAIAFAALWPARTALPGAARALASAAARPLVAGLGLAAAAWITAVGALDYTLTARAALRGATLLGTPAAPAATAPSPSTEPPAGIDPGTASRSQPVAAGGASAESESTRWRAEAQRLQGILDDPHKLEDYFTDKAAREYAQAKVETLALKGVPAKGAPEAPVQVVEYSDFLCPFCRNLAPALQSFLGQSGNRIQLFYKNYPLEQECNPNVQRTAHPGACILARGAICASDQGKFWPYHDRVFGQPIENPKTEDVVRLAGEVGLDTGAFSACLGSSGTRERLAAEVAEAKRVGVQATPTLFINGKKLPRINDFVQVVDKEAQAKGLPPLQTGAHAPNH
jgi:protein-disulfide isomerase/uncharacterized membrane protein